MQNSKIALGKQIEGDCQEHNAGIEKNSGYGAANIFITPNVDSDNSIKNLLDMKDEDVRTPIAAKVESEVGKKRGR